MSSVIREGLPVNAFVMDAGESPCRTVYVAMVQRLVGGAVLAASDILYARRATAAVATTATVATIAADELTAVAGGGATVGGGDVIPPPEPLELEPEELEVIGHAADAVPRILATAACVGASYRPVADGIAGASPLCMYVC